MPISYPKLIISIAIPYLVAALAGYATSSNISTWYTTLIKPWYAPPNYLFGPVWGVLYLLMGISLYMVWCSKHTGIWYKSAFVVFGVQLLLNMLWSFLFFHFKFMGVALLEITVLWLCIFLTILVFAKISKTAAWLLVPYIAWVTFAAVLNYGYYTLNVVDKL